jgi:mannosyl-glycoprotein endo-beta-N-acetylglucosaminidase
VKKTLVAGAITLSILGVSASTTYAEENQILPSTTTVEKTVISAVTEPKEKNALVSTEEVSNPTTSTTSTEPSSKSTEQVKKPEIKKEGWSQEENQWRYYENNKAVVNWKKNPRQVVLL